MEYAMNRLIALRLFVSNCPEFRLKVSNNKTNDMTLVFDNYTVEIYNNLPALLHNLPKRNVFFIPRKSNETGIDSFFCYFNQNKYYLFLMQFTINQKPNEKINNFFTKFRCSFADHAKG